MHQEDEVTRTNRRSDYIHSYPTRVARRTTGRYGSYQGLLRRAGPRPEGHTGGFRLPRGHQRRLRRVDLGGVLRHPAQRHRLCAAREAPHRGQGCWRVREGSRVLRRKGGQDDLAEQGAHREERGAQEAHRVPRRVTHVPRSHQAHHFRRQAVPVLPIRAVDQDAGQGGEGDGGREGWEEGQEEDGVPQLGAPDARRVED